MTTLLGMDDAQALELARRMQHGAERIEAVVQRLDRELAACSWAGTDRQRFESEWDGAMLQALRRVVDSLEADAAYLREQAAGQQHASR